MDVSAVGSNAFLNRHSSRQQMNVARRQHSTAGSPSTAASLSRANIQAHAPTNTRSYTLLWIAVIHQLSQYNGLSKGAIFQLKHLHTVVPSRALYHCITLPVIGKHSCTVGRMDDWVKLLFISWGWRLKWFCFLTWCHRRPLLLIWLSSCMQRAKGQSRTRLRERWVNFKKSSKYCKSMMQNKVIFISQSNVTHLFAA